MKYLIFLVFTCVSGLSFSQGNEELEKKEKPAKTPLNYYNNTINTVVMDSVFTIEDESAPSAKGAAQSQALDLQLNVYKSQVGKLSYRRTPLTTQQQKIEDLVSQLETAKPNSFEFHYFKYLSGNYNLDYLSHLTKAEELKPNNSDVHIQKIAANVIMGNSNLAKDYLKKILKSGRLNKELLYYSKDLLASIPKNGTLITHGFDDSYSAYYQSVVNQEREDVTIINLDFLQSETYRNKLKKEGYALPSGSVIDVAYFKSFCAKNSSKQLYVSMTVPKDYLKVVVNNLYVNGLTLHYATKKEDVFELNEKLWDNKLKKETLNKTLTNSKVKKLSSNYLPMLVILQKGYELEGDEKKKKEITEKINDLAVQSNKTSSVKRVMSN